MRTLAICGVNMFIWMAFTACSTTPVRDKSSLAQVSSEARSGNKKALERMVKTLSPQEKTSPELVTATIAELGPFIDEKEVSETVKPYLSNKDKEIRNAAFLTWQKRQSSANAAERHEVMNILLANEFRYPQLSEAEYQILGTYDDPNALEILKWGLGKNPDLDPVIIQSIGRILERNVIKEETPPQEKDSNEKRPDEKGSDENDRAQSAEGALLEYSGSQNEVSLKQLSIKAIENAYGPQGYSHLLSLLSNRSIDENTRIAILNYLAAGEKERTEQLLAEALPQARLWFSKEKTYLKRIDEVYLELVGKPLHTKSTSKKSAKQKKETLPPAKSILSSTSRRQIIRVKGRDRLVLLFHKYKLSEELVLQMERHAASLMNEHRLKLSPGTKFILVSLSKVKPNANFYELKELSKEGFTITNYYRGVMAAIIDSGRGYTWQILAIRGVWGVNESTAEILHKMFRAERRLI